MELAGISSVGSITVICYLVAEAIKLTSFNKKWIPIICGALGGVLGIAAISVIPNFPAADYITAAAIGIASGLAATGVNQVFKQMSASPSSSAKTENNVKK